MHAWGACNFRTANPQANFFDTNIFVYYSEINYFILLLNYLFASVKTSYIVLREFLLYTVIGTNLLLVLK